MIRRGARFLDDRLRFSEFARGPLNHVFPKHWSFMLGEIALYCFVILVLTGTFLAFFFEPSSERVLYHGRYEPLRGVEMSAAMRSAVELSFDVRAGLLVRQIHHWAAAIFLAAIVAHMLRVFFTGAYRRPREVNWLIGVGLTFLALSAAFSGYSMLDDLLSGTGLRVTYSLALSIPFVGPWIAYLIWGGAFPGDLILSRLFVFHVFVFPALIGLLLAAHMGIIWLQKHTQFPGRGRTERNVVGQKLWPSYTAKTLGLFFAVFAVVAALGGLAQINPVWLYGPYSPEQVTTGAQPDWYLMWVEGALRLVPNWEPSVFGLVLPHLFVPGVLFPIGAFALLALWPFLEARVTGDRDYHHLLDRPRDRPLRTALGVALLTLFALLAIAGGNDVLAVWTGLSVEAVTWLLRVVVVLVPPLAGLAAYGACRYLASERNA